MARHYFDTVINSVTGKPVASATIEVLSSALAYVTIYSDDGVTQIDQSVALLTSDAAGFFQFWTNETSGIIRISYDGEVKRTISDVEFPDGAVSVDVAAVEVRVDVLETQAPALAASGGSALVGHISDLSGATARTVQDRLRDWVSVFDFLTAAQIASVEARNLSVDVTAAIQAAIDAVYAAGGGTIYFPPGTYKTTAPLKCKDGVSLIGAGKGATTIKNALTPYNFLNSAVFQPGNFHLTYTENFYGHASTHAINAASAGATTVTLTTAGDAVNYTVGDMVWIFTTSYYLGSGLKVPEYGALAKIIGIAGAVLTLDRALSAAVTGSIHNLTTTTVAAADTTPLRAVADVRIADMSVETIGYWISDSAALRCQFENLHIAARAMAYGNTYQMCAFRNITGRVGVRVGELSHNSELTTVDGFDVAFDTAIATAAGVISVQENARGVAYRNGRIAMGGYAGSHALWWINATGCTFENLRLYNAPAFAGAALAFNSGASAAGKIACTNNVARGIEWSGDCERYVHAAGVGDESGNVIEGSRFLGAVSASEAIRLSATVLRNVIRASHFDQGPLVLASGVTKQEITDCYIGSGASLLTASDETLWRNNHLARISYADTIVRRLVNFTETGTPSLTTSEVNFVDAALGTNPLEMGDVIEVCLRVNVTGTTSTKTLTVKFYNGTTDVDLFDWIIAAGSTGTGWFKGTIAYVSSANIVCTGMAVIGGTAVYFNNAITSGIAGNPLDYRISGQLGNVADTCQVREITSRLNNPIVV